MAKAHAVRLDDETTEWLERYAKERGTDKGAVLRSAVAAFREDAERSVPDLESRPLTVDVPGVRRGSEMLAERQARLNKLIGW
jgi:predicted DNA-binding protein